MTTVILTILTMTYAAAGIVAVHFNLAHPTIGYSFTIQPSVATDSCSGIFCWQTLANLTITINNVLGYILDFIIQVFNLVTWPLTLQQTANPTMQLLAFGTLILIAAISVYKLVRSGSD